VKTCLINPVIDGYDLEGPRNDAAQNDLCHLGIGYIAAAVEARGFDVDIIECTENRITMYRLLDILTNEAYRMIGISVYSYNLKNTVALVKRIRRYLPDAFIFLGGYLPTLKSKLMFRLMPEIDCCVHGEGEYTVAELVEAVSGKRNWREIPGVVNKDQNIIKESAKREFIPDLDRLPFPKRTSISGKAASIITSRGCYGKCNFCSAPQFYTSCPGELLRFRSPSNVVDEIQYLVENHEVDFIKINDDNFMFSTPKRRLWIEEFYNLIKDRGIDVSFRIMIRANEVVKNREILLKLKDIGLKYLFIGVESFVQRQLDFYNKKINVETNIKALEDARSIGLKIRLGYIMLDPFTSLDEIIENIRILKETMFYNMVIDEHELVSCMIPLTPLLGSNFYDMMESSKLLIIGSELRYNFADPEVDLFYKVLKDWQGKVFHINKKSRIITGVSKTSRETANLLYNEKVKLFEIDLSFMEELAQSLKNNGMDYAGCRELIDRWAPLALQVEKVFEAYESDGGW